MPYYRQMGHQSPMRLGFAAGERRARQCSDHAFGEPCNASPRKDAWHDLCMSLLLEHINKCSNQANTQFRSFNCQGKICNLLRKISYLAGTGSSKSSRMQSSRMECAENPGGRMDPVQSCSKCCPHKSASNNSINPRMQVQKLATGVPAHSSGALVAEQSAWQIALLGPNERTNTHIMAEGVDQSKRTISASAAGLGSVCQAAASAKVASLPHPELGMSCIPALESRASLQPQAYELQSKRRPGEPVSVVGPVQRGPQVLEPKNAWRLSANSHTKTYKLILDRSMQVCKCCGCIQEAAAAAGSCMAHPTRELATTERRDLLESHSPTSMSQRRPRSCNSIGLHSQGSAASCPLC